MPDNETNTDALTGKERIMLAAATLGPVGRLPGMPGTWGSAVAALAAPWLFLPLSTPWRLAVCAALFVAGAIAATSAEKTLGVKDPGCVIIDEVLGQWLACLPLAGVVPLQLASAFLLFRFFDILKPWPVRSSETWAPAGWGVMLDDGVAGIMAAVCVYLLTFVL